MVWTATTNGEALVGRPEGRIDESNWQAFAAHLAESIASAAAYGLHFVVDLDGVDYMSSRGLRALSSALPQAQAASVAMTLAAPGESMREILAISRYDKLFKVHASVADALGGAAA